MLCFDGPTRPSQLVQNGRHRSLHSRVGLVEQKPDGGGIAIDFLDENGNHNLIRRHNAMLSRSGEHA